MKEIPGLTPDPNRRAVLYRMVMPGHVCPFGLKARHLLLHRDYALEDRWLRTRTEVDDFKERHGVATTPQTFIAGQRIGGYAELRQFFGLDRDADRASYGPVICAFLTAAVIAMATSWAVFGTSLTGMAGAWFISVTMMLLAMLKLQDIETFTTMFLGYDLLAKRWVPYAYAYPFLEWTAGALMAAQVLSWISIPIALVIGGIGAVSVVKAVYLEGRTLRCACVGGSGNVPLGAVSLAENLFMVGMALWMLAEGLSRGYQGA